MLCVTDEEDILVMRNLRKKFQTSSNMCVPKKQRKPPKTAVDGLCLTVRQGEVLGFLGPNGAGKTTTMNMVTGDSVPNEGEVCMMHMILLRMFQRNHLPRWFAVYLRCHQCVADLACSRVIEPIYVLVIALSVSN